MVADISEVVDTLQCVEVRSTSVQLGLRDCGIDGVNHPLFRCFVNVFFFGTELDLLGYLVASG